MPDTLDEKTLTKKLLSTAKATRHEHRIPFARGERHALCIFCQDHNTLKVAQAEVVPTRRPLSLSRELPSFSASPRLPLKPSDGSRSRRGRYKTSTREDRWWGLVDCLVLFAGRRHQKARESTDLKLRLSLSVCLLSLFMSLSCVCVSLSFSCLYLSRIGPLHQNNNTRHIYI